MRKYDTIIDGMGSLPQGTYTTVLIEGIGYTQGDIAFTKMRVDGTCKAKGKLEGEHLLVSGMFTGEDCVHVKQLEVSGMMKIKHGHVYGDEIRVSGFLKGEEEISADHIVVDGSIQAALVTGDVIDLNYRDVSKLGFVTSAFLGKKLFPKVDHIECTRLQASFLKCAHLCAQEIHLQNHCVIDVIECDGTIFMDDSCEVKEIRGHYTIVR